MERTWTQKGRVVYDRKKHFFRWTDSARITKKLDHLSFYRLKDYFAAINILALTLGALRRAGRQTVIEGLLKLVGRERNIGDTDIGGAFTLLFSGLVEFLESIFVTSEGLEEGTLFPMTVTETEIFTIDEFRSMVDALKNELRVILKEF